MTTVSVSFLDTWINLASDPTQAVHSGRTAGTAARSITGEVRQYAAGRFRGVLSGGISGKPTVTIRTNDRAIPDTLALWVGQTVCVRDELGRLDWAMFFTVPEVDLGMGWVDIALTLQTVTWSPAV
jgi:hypothetical protein